MIQIENLTDRQRQIMDLLWSCRDHEQVKTLIRALPNVRDQLDAISLVDIATWQVLEQEGALNDYEQAAKDCISRARSSR